MTRGTNGLTDRVQATLNRLFPMMERVIRLERVPVQKLELFGFRDPEEDWQELVVSLSVNLPESEALLLWDKLGHTIEGMMEYLPSYMVNILYDRISIEVLGNVGEVEGHEPAAQVSSTLCSPVSFGTTKVRRNQGQEKSQRTEQ